MAEQRRYKSDDPVDPIHGPDDDQYAYLVRKAKDGLDRAYRDMGHALFLFGGKLPKSAHLALHRFWQAHLTPEEFALVSGVMGWRGEINSLDLGTQSAGVFEITGGKTMGDYDALKTIDWLPTCDCGEAEMDAINEENRFEPEPPPLPTGSDGADDEIPF